MPDNTLLYLDSNLTVHDVLNYVYSRKEINFNYILDRNDASTNMGKILFQFIKDQYLELKTCCEAVKFAHLSKSSNTTRDSSLTS